MSRANVASATAYAGAWLNFAFRQSAVGAVRSPDPEYLARWFVPAILFGFIVILVAVSGNVILKEQDRIIAAASNEMGLLASVLAADVEHHMREGADKSLPEALSQATSSRALARGQKVYLSDENGNIIAGYPDAAVSGTIADRLGAVEPLTTLAQRAGVMRLTLADGADALTTAHTIQTLAGQIIIVHPMVDILADWREMLTRTIVLICTITAILGALALGYFWQAAKALQADCSRRRMRDHVDMALARGRCGLWDWDLVTGKIFWSTSMYTIAGLAPREAMSFAAINELIHPEDGGLDAITRTLSINPASTIDHVFRLRNASGGWVWLRAKAELVTEAGGTPHLAGIAIDITETMALEERSARADMRLRDAIETISEAFVVWDANNRLVMCNSKFQRFHNLPSDAVKTGTPYAKVMERGSAPLVQQVAMGQEQPMGARTFEAQLRDGRWLQINERRTKDGGYVSVGTDITALKRHEEQLLESESRLLASNVDLRKARQNSDRQAQELAELAQKYYDQKDEAEKASRAKSDFLANMSHELRTPLNAILGFSEIMSLESYGPLGSPLYSEYSRDIHTSGQYLLGVIADVLEMARLEAGRVMLEKTTFVVTEAIVAAKTSVARIAEEKTIEIISELSGSKLNADRTAVEKILTILLNNAVKYTPAGGKVSVHTRTAQGAMTLYVEDTGIGITPGAIARLGKPFEQSDLTLKNGMRGSGLGLAIARSLVELHGGKMQISSKQDKGTVVLVQLPNRQPSIRPALQLAASSGVATMHPPRFAIQRADRTPKKISRTA